MKRLTEAWMRFWFEPAPAATLGVCRFLFFLGVLVFQLPGDVAAWTDVPTKSFYRPIPLFKLLNLPHFSHGMVTWFEFVWIVSLVMNCIGFLTRWSVTVSLVLGIYLLGLPNNFGKTGHGDAILVLTMGILALSRCGDAWSVDSLVRAARGVANPQASGEYRWPIRMVWVLMSIVFFASGVAKLRRSGLEWITSDNMAIVLLQHQYNFFKPPLRLGFYIARFGWLCHAIAGGTVLLELTFPVVLFVGFLRKFIVPLTLLMQLGIGLLMGVWFTQFLFCYLFWVPWDRIRAALVRHRSHERKLVVLFDGGCGLCRRTANVVDRLNLLDRIDLLDITKWETISPRFPQIDRQRAIDDMHAVDADGRVAIGFDAYRQMAWKMPLTWIILPLLYVPAVPQVGRRIYRYVATHRSTTCLVPSPGNPRSPRTRGGWKG